MVGAERPVASLVPPVSSCLGNRRNPDEGWSQLVPAGLDLGATNHTTSGYLETWRRIDVWPDSVQVSGETLKVRGCPPVSLVWLSIGVRSRRAPCEGRLERGLFCSK
jgi:hypothetical protein